MLNFQEIKPLIRDLCDELDEHLLLPGAHPVLTATKVGEHYDVRYRERRYLIPLAEVLVLPVGNTSAENLAAWFGRALRQRIAERWPQLVVRQLSVGVEEAPGQRGVWTLRERE